MTTCQLEPSCRSTITSTITTQDNTHHIAVGETDHKSTEQHGNVTQHEDKVVRICVLGATGVGKSTLCNFLCDTKDEFKTQRGPVSCTKEVQSHRLIHNIADAETQFEIVDTPGWFDCTSGQGVSRVPSASVMIHKIRECAAIADSGITAFFLVIPYDRLSIDIEHSLYFMRDCFDASQLRHVWMIFTKCHDIKTKDEMLNIFKQQKDDGQIAATILYNYSQTINEQCYVTECEDGDEKQLCELRHKILNDMNDLYEECGTVPQSAFQIAQIEHKQEVQSVIHREQKKWLLGSLSILIPAGVGLWKIKLAHDSLFTENTQLQNDKRTLKHDNNALQNDKSTLQAANNGLKYDNSTLQEANNGLKEDAKSNDWKLGICEVVIGTTAFVFEPVTSSIAIADGFRRLTGSQDD